MLRGWTIKVRGWGGYMGNGFAGTGICFERRSRICGKGNCIRFDDVLRQTVPDVRHSGGEGSTAVSGTG